MVVWNLYSKRKAQAERSGKADVYQYDELPKAFRVQVVHIWQEAIGAWHHYSVKDNWQEIEKIIAKENGLFSLGASHFGYPERCANWFRDCETDKALDLIELTFRVINQVIRGLNQWERKEREITASADDAISELNARFREHGIGYQFEAGEIMRIDSQYVHANLVKPAIQLLAAPLFAKANENFLQAHHHYRDRNYKDCVVAANRAFESALKAICADMKWEIDKNARASDLIKVVRSEGLFPGYLDKGLDAFIAVMKAGLPEVRNNAGGHGEEPSAKPIPDYIAAYALHLSATNLVLVANAFEQLGKRRG